MNRKLLILVACLVFCIYGASAQEALYKYDFGGGLGVSGYLGDANNSSLLKHPGITAEAGVRYIPNVRWAFRGLFGFTTLSGDSSEMENVLPGGQNYSFKAKVYSLDARAEFNFLPYGIGETYKKLSRFSPYLVLGLGLSVSSVSGGSHFAPTLPMGVGVKYKLKQRLNLGLEFTMTKVFSDRVDGDALSDPLKIPTSFIKNTDWYSRLALGVTYEFGERCQTCHYVD